MTIQKELSDIAWNVPEKVYRDDPSLSQSTLGTYERVGFNGLDHLFDKKETPSLTFGSCVDSIITGGKEEFNSRFSVLDVKITDGGMDTVKQLLSLNLPYDKFQDIPEAIVSQAAKDVGFWKADRYDKRRYAEVLNTGNIAEYYEKCKSSDKTIITTETFQEVMACVKALRDSAATSWLFAEDDIFSPIRRYYQLKFKLTNNGVSYRGMMDLLIVDYEKKIVYPYDLKTSSGCEWDFEEHFIQWGYNWQARLYWRLLRANMNADPYFKDFELKNFKFIVVNKKTLTPLVWEFPLTKEFGTLVDKEGNEYRDPFTIGEELQRYLALRPTVPVGIEKDGVNIINCLKKKREDDNKEADSEAKRS